MIYTATTGAERGPGAGMLAAASVALGGVCYTLITAIGISAALAAYPALFTVIRAGGVLYLIYLGVKRLMHVRDAAPLANLPNASEGVFRTGFVIALTNAQLALFFLALLPQVIAPGERATWVQFLTLGLTFNACAFTAMTIIGTVAGIAGNVGVSDVRYRQGMRVVSGLAFIAVAIWSASKLIK